ncbi:MAG: hypothetical protein LBI49_19200, partial [Nocardiopsaceae bacterium]|nr:hypothetical protein [Nocardiopsaceae bacterium]
AAGAVLASPLGLTGAAPWYPAARPAPNPQASLLATAWQLLELPPVAGATGTLPVDQQPSPGLVRDARHPGRGVPGQQANAAPGQPTGLPGLPVGGLGIPAIVLRAYLHAQQVLAREQPGCHLRWWMLAAIGQVESGQADDGLVDRHGTTLVPILGPVLNGAHGTAAIPAGGRGSSGPVWARAVGPMQFLPSTWQIWGGGGNPNNVYDAALATGRYLCAGGRNLSVPGQLVAAIFSYNHSNSYVRLVLSWAHAYSRGVTALPRSVLYPVTNRQAGGGSRGSSRGPAGTSGSQSGQQSRRSRAPSGSSGGSSSGGSSSGGSRSPSPSGSSSSPTPVTSSPAPSPSASSPDPSPPPSPAPSPSDTSPSPSPTDTATATTSSDPSSATPSAQATG